MEYNRIKDKIQNAKNSSNYISRLLEIKKLEIHDSVSIDKKIKRTLEDDEYSKIFGNNKFTELHYRVLLYLLRGFTFERVKNEERINLGRVSDEEIIEASKDIEKYLEAIDEI